VPSEEFSIVVLEDKDDEEVVVDSLVVVSTKVEVLKLVSDVERVGVIGGLGSENSFDKVVDSDGSLDVGVFDEVIVDSVDDNGGVIEGVGLDIVVEVLDSVVVDSIVVLSVEGSVSSVVLSVEALEVGMSEIVDVVSVEEVTLGKDSVVDSVVISSVVVGGAGSPKSGAGSPLMRILYAQLMRG